MKVSEITVIDIANYMKLDDYEARELEVYLSASRSYIKSYTGLDDSGMDMHNDFTIVVYILCQDMYFNRTMYVENNNISRVVETILGMHSTNLLPSSEVTA